MRLHVAVMQDPLYVYLQVARHMEIHMKNTRKDTWIPTTTTMINLMFLLSGAKVSAIPNRNVAPLNDIAADAFSRTPRHCNTPKAMCLIVMLITTIGTVRRYVFWANAGSRATSSWQSHKAVLKHLDL